MSVISVLKKLFALTVSIAGCVTFNASAFVAVACNLFNNIPLLSKSVDEILIPGNNSTNPSIFCLGIN